MSCAQPDEHIAALQHPTTRWRPSRVSTLQLLFGVAVGGKSPHSRFRTYRWEAAEGGAPPPRPPPAESRSIGFEHCASTVFIARLWSQATVAGPPAAVVVAGCRPSAAHRSMSL